MKDNYLVYQSLIKENAKDETDNDRIYTTHIELSRLIDC